jgi:hypothetical protein
MTLPRLSEDSMSIVLRGTFRPGLITPRWLHSVNLVGSAELDAAEYALYVPEQAIRFQAQWLSCVAQQDLLQLSTSDEREFERLRDVAVGILHELDETPLSVLGINRNVHFAVPDNAAYHSVGDSVTDKKMWDGILVLPGMRTCTISGVRPDEYAGRVDVRVEPSGLVRPGVFVACNDHYELQVVDRQPETRDDSVVSSTDAVQVSADKNPVAREILVDDWGASIARSEAIISRVAAQGV